jgi:hypothetical protein
MPEKQTPNTHVIEPWHGETNILWSEKRIRCEGVSVDTLPYGMCFAAQRDLLQTAGGL